MPLPSKDPLDDLPIDDRTKDDRTKDDLTIDDRTKDDRTKDGRPLKVAVMKPAVYRELDRFIAASDERIQKKQNLQALQPGGPGAEEANRKKAEASMARTLAASLEPELLAILQPRYEGSPTGERGRIYFTVEEKTFYIICDPFFKDGDVQAGWFGIMRKGAHEQLTMLHFRGGSFQDDLLQAIRHAR
jgi:hypothetical protein